MVAHTLILKESPSNVLPHKLNHFVSDRSLNSQKITSLSYGLGLPCRCYYSKELHTRAACAANQWGQSLLLVCLWGLDMHEPSAFARPYLKYIQN